jgi:hypothetical protein
MHFVSRVALRDARIAKRELLHSKSEEPVWIEAVVGKEDLARVAAQLAPLEIQLGDAGGTLRLEDPSEISLIPTVGLHLQCTAHLQWPVLGIKIPVTIKPLLVRVLPEIDKREQGDALVFKIQIEHADVAGVPTIIDNEITNLINRELIKKNIDLSWSFADMLSYDFDLSKALPPVRTLGVKVVGGTVRITEDTLVLAVSFETSVTRKPDQEKDEDDDDQEITKPGVPGARTQEYVA